MTRPASARPLLDAETVEFVARRVSMAIAGRNADNVPSSVRGCGCRVAPDGRLMTVFVSWPQAAALLRDIEANGAVAAVFSQPTTHRTMQFKGSDARVVPLAPGDAQLVAAFVGSFVVELAPLGHGAPFVHAVLGARPEDLAAIAFTPSDGFAQTPGPGAGAPLPGR
ncbi:MAG TPA: pyridoxamine 5'-phosphate oxidase family protein [Casimicrobiaceae bacterium]|nr:pyridoxamine 5'-phosphate oxidase family protein [Casimicrobiaceae bacterium]